MGTNRGDASVRVDAPDGRLPAQTAGALVYALARDRECFFALWSGYAENSAMAGRPLDVPAWVPLLLGRLSLIPADTVSGLNIPWDIVLIREPLSWLARELPALPRHCPLLILLKDHSFVAACPIYHDSFTRSRYLVTEPKDTAGRVAS